MNYTIHTAPQGTPEWLAARAGCATGSRAGDILARIKSGEAAARRDYRYQLAAERLTGKPQDDVFVNAAMQWGTEQEPFARMAYEAATGNIVRETGFLRLDGQYVGCSLDGDVDDMAGIIEIKCPKTATHIEYLTACNVPTKYLPQIRHNLHVSGAQWCDFISFDPRLPDNLQLLVVRVSRADADVEGYAAELQQFLAEVSALENQLRNRK